MIKDELFQNTLFEKLHQDLPEYDDFMYLKGYSPQEVYTAFRRTMNRQIQERQAAQQNAQAMPTPEADNITIRGEVILNGKRL